MDSNHRRHSQQIYSLSPLTTRVPLHIGVLCEKEVAMCVGIEPTYSIIELTPLHLSNVVERKRFELLDAFHINGFQDHRFQPLSHLSIIQLKSLTYLILTSKTPSKYWRNLMSEACQLLQSFLLNWSD